MQQREFRSGGYSRGPIGGENDRRKIFGWYRCPDILAHFRNAKRKGGDTWCKWGV